tara:strand:- start:374 stop:538 length:165 start_codon:yes stop_codon:yes gene_type:complete
LSEYFKNSEEIKEELIDYLIDENKRLEVRSRAKINKSIQAIIDKLEKSNTAKKD